MAQQHTPPEMSPKTEHLSPDNESDRDSGVGEDLGQDADICTECNVTADNNFKEQDGMKENGGETEDSMVFVAFQGNMDDEDFTQKLDTILRGIPNVLDMGKFLEKAVLFILVLHTEKKLLWKWLLIGGN